ncbi:toll-like receptor 3 [Sitodiplosis mosellana]|uniref:toll-like receptor 3 n=1 Tax=Sitodiplosis mosellana TaxID=263140 RepID=UPI002444C989|nr:toll-like receptor 3 [Sitodiplosis mosellana]
MKFLVFSVFFIICVNSSEILNGYIGDCSLKSSFDANHDTLTFICVKSFRQTDLFSESATSTCSEYTLTPSNTEFYKNQIVQISFEDCSMSNLGYRIFEVYKNVTVLNASHLGLESLQKLLFQEAKHLNHLDVSHNNIAELSSFLFVNAEHLKEADFSFNHINRIDLLAFAGDSKLEQLSFAHNNITTLQKQLFDYLLNLRHLNLSHNSITNLEEHTFDNLTNLKVLDLSFNPLEQLSIKTFASLTKLQRLNLSHTQLTEIKAKTLCRLEELQTLDLSHNNLIVLDVRAFDGGIFLPKFDYLKTLFIGGNQLNELNGFTSERFPVMKIVGIPDNKFDCCYLIKLFRSIGWKQLELPFDDNSKHPNLTDSMGVKCNFGDEFLYEAESPHYTWAEILTVICILLLALLFVMVGAIMKTTRKFRSSRTNENMNVPCDSISNFDNSNMYDVPKI